MRVGDLQRLLALPASAPERLNVSTSQRLNVSTSQRRSPDGIRTHATAVRGRRPRPLDDGARTDPGCQHSPTRCVHLIAGAIVPVNTAAGVPGLEPRMAEPESAVLPITPYPTGHLRPLLATGFVDLACVEDRHWPPLRADVQTIKCSPALPRGARRPPRAAAAGCAPGPAAPTIRTTAG